ncbi:MAG: peptidylprolyl isomerase [Candidatus Hydrogenedentota bacterium]|nr:MAG: peptidylprolyl isomerase [Candidatus Hydrogenedentota bacterium]
MQAQARKLVWMLVTALVLGLIASPAAAEKEQSSREKVAVVNGSVITQADLDMELSKVQERFPGIGSRLTDSQLSGMKNKTLEDLIDRELLYLKSQEEGIKVDEAVIKEQMGALERRLRRKMAIEQFIEQEFPISEEKVRAFYDDHPERFKQPEQVRASHILIKVDQQADESQKAETRKKIEDIQRKLQGGEDFAAVATEFSDCPSSAKGGDLGYFGRRRMVKPFADAAFALNPGEVSDIVETRFGYHLIKVVDKKPEAVTPYEDVKDRLEDRLRRERVQKEVNPYVGELKKEAKIERFLTEEPQ